MLNESKQTYKAESVSEHVYGLLYEKILSGEWPVDSKIPNEFDLCDAFGASRISVRSAIQRLISMGMLEVKRGDGTYVKSFSLRRAAGGCAVPRGTGGAGVSPGDRDS